MEIRLFKKPEFWKSEFAKNKKLACEDKEQ